jgi:hypothetical protein
MLAAISRLISNSRALPFGLIPLFYRVFIPERISIDENSFFSKHLYEFLIKVLLPLLEEQLQGNLQITHTEIELLTGYFSGAFCGLARWWLQTGMPYSPAEIGRRYVEIFRDGFVAASQSWS